MLVIQVYNLSKKYLIRHEERAGYETLRETIYKLPGNLLKRNYQLKKEEFWALRNISFKVKQGEKLAIIGQNGAGKSTLLKILSRITEPTSGRISLKGRIASLLEIGTGFHPELTGKENIYLNGSVMGLKRSEIRKKFDQIVQFAEVEKFLDTPVKRYSSGMAVRLAFSVAAHLEPEILLVDEVLAVGDHTFQKKCLGKMNDVAKEGRTVLFVTHNMSAASSLCERGILLDKGEIKLISNIDETVNTYLQQLMKASKIFSKTTGTRFIKIQTVDQHGNPKDVFNNNDVAYLEFYIYVEDNRELNLGITLINSKDMPIISSNVLDSLSQIPIGENKLKILLPVNLLHYGTYRVEGALWNNYNVIDQSDNLTSFQISSSSVLDIKGLGSRGILKFPYQWESCNNFNERGPCNDLD